MASSLGELLVKIGIDASALNKGLDSAIKDLNKMGNQAQKGLGPIMDKIGAGLMVVGSAAAAGFGAAVVAGVKANSNMEQYRATLETVMGDSQKAAEKLDWVKKFAAKTPFEIPELVESTVKLQAMGLEAEKMLPIAGDMAAVFASSGKTVGMATEAINDAMMGEFSRLKEFGIKLSQTDFKEGGKYAGKSYAEAIAEEVKNHNYTGAADKLSQTFSGRLSTLKDTLMGALSTATAPIFDKIAVGLGNLITKIEELQASGTLDQWVATATAAFDTFWAIGEVVFDAIINVGKYVIDNWGLIGPIVAGVVGAFVAFQVVTGIINIAKSAMMAFNLVMALNPISLVVLAIAALIAIGVALYMHWDQIKAYAAALWASLVAVFEGIRASISEKWEAIKTAAVEKFTAIRDFITGIWEAVKQSIIAVWESIKFWITTTWAIIKAIFTGDFGALRQIGYDMFNNIWEGIKGIWNSIKSWIDSKVSWLKDKLTFWKSSQDKMSEGGGSYIGSNAQGTDYWRGGLTWVGEEGPELLNLPRGSQIIPNNKINQSLGAVGPGNSADAMASAVGNAVMTAMQFSQPQATTIGPAQVNLYMDKTKVGRILLPEINKEQIRRGTAAIVQGV